MPDLTCESPGHKHYAALDTDTTLNFCSRHQYNSRQQDTSFTYDPWPPSFKIQPTQQLITYMNTLLHTYASHLKPSRHQPTGSLYDSDTTLTVGWQIILNRVFLSF